MPERPVYSSVETLNRIELLERRLEPFEAMVVDHEERFDTLQTPLPRRILFWIQGWPFVDLNAPRRQRRPWRRGSWRWRRR